MGRVSLWAVDCERSAAALWEVGQSRPELLRAAGLGSVPVHSRGCGHLALRLLLAAMAGSTVASQPFVRGRYGKPTLPRGEVAFSLSHCEGFALIGLGRTQAIGVDIERVEERRLAEPWRATFAALAVAMNGPLPNNPDRRLIQAWARLEASSKATGDGMGRLIDVLGARRAARDALARLSVGEAARSYLDAAGLVVRDVSLPGDLCAAVAGDAACVIAEPVWLPDRADAIADVLATAAV